MLRDGRRLRIRAIDRSDAAALVEMGRRSTPEDLRLRFFGMVRPEPGPLASLLSDFDHDRQIAVAAYDPNSAGAEDEFLGVVRLICAPDNRQGEFSIMVRSDLKGQGLGAGLMREMLDWASKCGLARVEGRILAENKTMLQLARKCGAVIEPSDDDFLTVRVAFSLATGA